MSDNLDLAISLLGDLDVVAEVSGAALNLDAVVQELLEGLDVKDLVVHRLRAVDDELSIIVSRALFQDCSQVNMESHTFLVTLVAFLPWGFYITT